VCLNILDKKKKTVAVFCFSGGGGGMEHDAVKLAVKLNKNADVVLVCKRNSFIESLYKEGRYSFPCVSIAFASRMFSLSMFFRIRGFLRQYAPANVIFFGASELKTLYFAFLGFDLNLLVRHGTTKSRPKTDWFHRLIYSRVNYHIALSKHLLDNVRKIVPPSKTVDYRIIYPSFEMASGGVSSSDDGRVISIVHVGRVADGKGQIDAVYACRQLHEKEIDFSFDVMGGFEGLNYVSLLKNEISRSDLAEQVHLHGHVTNVEDYLRSADIFLFPSAGEGMPNAFIEAMYFGAVCIAYDNTVFPEFLEMGFYIHVVDNLDKDALAKKLVDVVENLHVEKEASIVNVALVEKYFSQKRELADWDIVLR